MVVMWDLQKLEQGRMIAQITSSVYAVHFDTYSGLLYIGQNFDGIHVIDVEKRKEVASIQLTSKEIFDIQSDQQFVYLATGEGEVIWVEKTTHAVVHRVKCSTMNARCIDHVRDHLVVGFSDNHIRLLRKVDGSITNAVKGHEISVFTVRYDEDRDRILSGSRDAHLKAWNSRTLELEEDVPAHMYAINHIEFSPDRSQFVSCSMDKSIKIWDSTSFKLQKVIDKARNAGHGTSVNKLLWMSDMNFLVSCSDDRTISVWEVINNGN